MSENTIINITNHKLNADQLMDFGRVIELPEDLKCLWAQVGPTEAEVHEAARKVYAWIHGQLVYLENPAVAIAVQGHFGATFKVVRYLQRLEIKAWPVYAVSERVSVEEAQPDGTVKKSSVFKHVRWNQY